MNETTFFQILIGTILVLAILWIYWLLQDWIESSKQRKAERQYLAENIKVNKQTNLLVVQEYVLDQYEQSNIRIPVEIIDDLQNSKLDQENDIFDFVEIQRQQWKLENSKKLFRKKV